MTVLAIIAALLLEQWRALDSRAVTPVLGAWSGWLEQQFNGGERRHGMVAWLVAVLPPVLVAAGLHALLSLAHPLLGLAFNVAVLYATSPRSSWP
jgi:adenosylcobinamide-phosphate synthase